MDNAAKSIIMVGGVIIGTIVISIMVYMFSVFGSFSGDMAQKIGAEKALKFNSDFFQYEGRVDITAQEIVSCINKAKQQNDSTGLGRDESGHIHVIIHDESGTHDVLMNDPGQSPTIDAHTTTSQFISDANAHHRIYRCGAYIRNVFTINYDDSWYTSISGKNDINDVTEEEKAEMRRKYSFDVEYEKISNDIHTTGNNRRGNPLSVLSNHVVINPSTSLVDEIHFFIANRDPYNSLNLERCVFNKANPSP